MSDCFFDPTDCDIMSARRISYGYENGLHYHDSYELYLFLKGDTDFYFDQYSLRLEPGMLIAIRPEYPHKSICTNKDVYDRVSVNITEKYLKKLSSEKTNLLCCFEKQEDLKNYIRILDSGQITAFLDISNKLEMLATKKAYGKDILKRAYTEELMVFVNDIFKNGSESSVIKNVMPEMIHRIVHYVMSNLNEEITLNKLGKEMYLNPTYISRKFKEYMGITIQQYIIMQRLIKACNILRRGGTVTDACNESGFNDYANFIRTFKKNIGVSPGKYVKQKEERYEK